LTMRCVRVGEESTVRRVPVTDVTAGMLWSVLGVDLFEVRRPGFTSYFSPSLRRPVIWPKTVQ